MMSAQRLLFSKTSINHKFFLSCVWCATSMVMFVGEAGCFQTFFQQSQFVSISLSDFGGTGHHEK